MITCVCLRARGFNDASLRGYLTDVIHVTGMIHVTDVIHLTGVNQSVSLRNEALGVDAACPNAIKLGFPMDDARWYEGMVTLRRIPELPEAMSCKALPTHS